jgi:hypothetical protein
MAPWFIAGMNNTDQPNWTKLGFEAAQIVKKLEKNAGPRNALGGKRSTGASKSAGSNVTETRQWLRHLARKQVVGANVY